MKKSTALVFAYVVIILSFTTANAEYLGSIEPVSHDQIWNISMGIGYQYYSDKIDIGSTSHKIKQNQVFLQLSSGVRNIEGYIRVGGADLRMEDAFDPNIFGGKSEFKDDSYKAFFTGGGRGSIPVSDNFSINPFGQITFTPTFKDHADGTVGGLPVRQEIEVSFYEVEAGLFFQGKLKPITLYAGPFIYWIRGDNDLKEKGNFGGAAGIRFQIGGNLSIGIEAQYRQEPSAGGMIGYTF